MTDAGTGAREPRGAVLKNPRFSEATRYRAFRALLSARTLTSRPTSRWRVEPDFLIVGAQRAGTTTLYRLLAEHPAIRFPNLTKGIHWFDVEYHRPRGWYRAHFPLRAVVSRQAARAGEAVRVGEASPYYGFHPFVPGRIAEHLPDARVVLIARDPVTRAWSQFHHERARGWETLDDFEAALAAEHDRLADAERTLAGRPGLHHEHQHNSYVARGQYREQIERLWNAFGRERVLVLYNEDLDRDPGPVVDRLHDFLGVSRRAVAPGRWNPRSQGDIPAAAVARIREATAASDAWMATHLDQPPPWIES